MSDHTCGPRTINRPLRRAEGGGHLPRLAAMFVALSAVTAAARTEELSAKVTDEGGLRLELKMDQSDLSDGQAWTGRLLAVNSGNGPVRLYLGGRLEFDVRRSDGRPAERYLYIAAGATDPAAQRPPMRELGAGESVELAVFDRSEPFSALAGRGGNALFGWRLGEGEYSLRARYTVDAETLGALGEMEAWQGTLESAPAVVRVRERPIATAPVQGLQLSLEGSVRKLGLRFRNASEQPIVVDTGGFPPMTPGPMRVRVTVRDAEGRPIDGYLQPTSFPGESRKGQFVRIAPGESYWLCTYSPAFIPSLINGAGLPAGRLAPGRYTLRAVYECNRDESADVGADGPALVVRVESADVEVEVPERRPVRRPPASPPAAELQPPPGAESRQ